MLREEDKDQASQGGWRKFSRSVSLTERPTIPRRSISKPQWNSKARACLPPLQPLSIVRPSIEEWPKAGSDDLGIWPNPPTTPGARSGSVTPRENSTSDQPPREFEFKKDKLAFFDKECSRILDHIYLGSDAVAKNREVLRHNGITHVLNCVGFVCPEYFKNDIVYKTLWLQDRPSEDITSILYDVFDYFEDVREQSGRVFVHCCQGVSRSTSLVIAYLMWKDGQSFDDAFQHVKAARGVTNPNVGFACQLLQCQKRVHALPASPTSLLRMYRMAPHSPYDPLHLVPKILCEPGADRLDSRGAFIIHIPTALYVWTGRFCSPVMSENASAAASQIFRYESVQGPVLTVKEGEETFDFWDALSYKKSLTDACHANSHEKSRSSPGSDMVPANSQSGQRKLDDYDLDFEIFRGALSGGVVPPFPLPGAGSETCLPARENHWNRLRRKFAIGKVKEFIASSKFKSSPSQTSDRPQSMSTCDKVEDVVSSADLSMPSSSLCNSPDSIASYEISNPGWAKTNLKEEGFSAPLSDTSLSRSPSFSLVDSFSSFLVGKQNSNSTSPSVSPSTSDYSSSFTFSPSSSNLSDLSFVSAQPSLYGPEARNIDPGKSGPPEESVGSVEDSTCILDNAASSPSEEAISACRTSFATGFSPNFGDTLLPVERRASSISPRMVLPSIDEASQVSENLTKYLKDDAMRDVQFNTLSREVSFEMDGEEPISDVNSNETDDDDEFFGRLQNEKKYDTFYHRLDDITNTVTEVTSLLFYQWPSMHKLDMHNDILDSRSIYFVLIPAANLGNRVADVLYVWIGRSVALQEIHYRLIRKDSTSEDIRVYFEKVGRNLLTESRFSTDAQVKIVKEGEEPVELLNHFTRLSLGKDLDGGIKSI